jgi:transcriptional regulator with XRE-family HTH domain
MEMQLESPTLDQRLAHRLKALRAERGWTLDQLADRASVSRAALSRLENAEVSPTAAVLGRLCAAHGMTLSRLMTTVEQTFTALIPAAAQAIWQDPAIGFRRRIVSPPAGALAGEAIEVTLEPATRIAYDAPPRPGLEHHLLMRDGALTITIDDPPSAGSYALGPGDCLRYQLFGRSTFTTPPDCGARYLLFVV